MAKTMASDNNRIELFNCDTERKLCKSFENCGVMLWSVDFVPVLQGTSQPRAYRLSPGFSSCEWFLSEPVMSSFLAQRAARSGIRHHPSISFRGRPEDDASHQNPMGTAPIIKEHTC